MVRRIGYVILSIFMLSSVFLYNYRGLRFLFAVVLLVPVVSQIFVWLHSMRCRVELEGEERVCTRGEKIEVPIRIYNNSFFPVFRILVQLEWKFVDGTCRRWTGRIEQVDGRGMKEWVLLLPTEHCGHGTLHVRSIKVYDYLLLCAAQIRGDWQVELAVCPNLRPVESKELEELLKSGLFLCGEIEDAGEYIVRGYREGDSMHRVHWKLSAKQEELQVRDVKQNTNQGVSMFLDCASAPDDILTDSGKLDWWDAYLERAAAIFLCLYHGSVGLKKIAWTESGEYVEQTIESQEDIQTCIFRLLRILPATRNMDEGTKEKMAAVGDRNEVFLRLDTALKLYWGERCIYE